MLQDLGLPPDAEGVTEGIATLREILTLAPHDQGDRRDRTCRPRQCASRPSRSGAYDFYQKPVDTDVLRLLVRRAFHIHALEEQNRRACADAAHSPLEGFIATDDAMLKVCRMIEKVAPTNAIDADARRERHRQGSWCARAVHALSPRAKEQFVAINCAAIPEQLLESELFGYEKGAFTGAVKTDAGQDRDRRRRHVVPRRDRRHAAAAAGQATALPAGARDRARRRARRRSRSTCASSAPPTRTCSRHRRAADSAQDLYYRIGEVTIDVPPLRERVGGSPCCSRVICSQVPQRSTARAAARVHAERRCTRIESLCVARQRARDREHGQGRHDHGGGQVGDGRGPRFGRVRRPRRG